MSPPLPSPAPAHTAPPAVDEDALDAYDFALPPELVAQEPTAERDGARLLHVERRGAGLTHRRFIDLPAQLEPGDLLVVNDTRVFAARLRGRKATGAEVELLLVTPEPDGAWRCLGQTSKLKAGTGLDLGDSLRAEVDRVLGDGFVRVRFEGALATAPWEAGGEVPLPPYIDPRAAGHDAAFHRERYQTVFARASGAVAAPTAGLHFTPRVLDALAARGVGRATVTLHVGPDTFLPVRGERLTDHRLQGERFEVPAATAAAIAATRAAGRRVVAVGTTVVRALESTGGEAGAGTTTLFLKPGHAFRAVDALVTNFHLPRSTLLALVSAFAGRERVLAAYAEAVASRYRFYSYGDAMLIL